MYLLILRVHFEKRSAKDILMRCLYVVLFLIFFVKAYVVGTHLIELHQQIDAIQMGTYNICLYKVDKKYTGCNLKTTELLHYALIGVCAVIRSNTACRKQN